MGRVMLAPGKPGWASSQDHVGVPLPGSRPCWPPLPRMCPGCPPEPLCLAQATHLTSRGSRETVSLDSSHTMRASRSQCQPREQRTHYLVGIQEAVRGQGKRGYFKGWEEKGGRRRSQENHFHKRESAGTSG